MNCEEYLSVIDLMTKVYYPQVSNFMSYDDLHMALQEVLVEKASTFEDRGIPFENCLKVWCKFKTYELVKAHVKDSKLRIRLERAFHESSMELPTEIGVKICFIARTSLQARIVELLIYMPSMTQVEIATMLDCTQPEVSYVKRKLRKQMEG
jgi:predicted XRE-type DNA-binding protein